MMLTNLKYFIKQGSKNIVSHKMMSFASVCIMAASFMLLGLFVAVGLNVNSFMDKLGDSCEINVYIKADAAGRSISEIEGDLKNIDGVSEVRFYSREDRLNKVTEEVYGKDGYAFSSDTNPLRDSYILVASDLSNSEKISADASEIAGVEEVIQNQDIISGIDVMTKAIKNIGVWIMLILLLLAVFITSNTIKLGMASHGEEIKIMKIVGATDGFIRAPFVIQGTLLGILGAIPASIAVSVCYGVIINKVSATVPSTIISFVSLGNTAMVVIPMFFAVGIVVGIIGSYTAAGRYFK